MPFGYDPDTGQILYTISCICRCVLLFEMRRLRSPSGFPSDYRLHTSHRCNNKGKQRRNNIEEQITCQRGHDHNFDHLNDAGGRMYGTHDD